MADVRANSKFKFRRSRNPGYIPKVADLLEGELFINIADKKLYTKDEEANVVIGIGGGGGSGGGGELGGGAIIIRPEDAVNSNGNLILSSKATPYDQGLSGVKMEMLPVFNEGDYLNESMGMMFSSKTGSVSSASTQHEYPGQVGIIMSNGFNTGYTGVSGAPTITATNSFSWRTFEPSGGIPEFVPGTGPLNICSSELNIGNTDNSKFVSKLTCARININAGAIKIGNGYKNGSYPSVTIGTEYGGQVDINGLKTLKGIVDSTAEVGTVTATTGVIKGNLYVEGEIISGSPTPGPKPAGPVEATTLNVFAAATFKNSVDISGPLTVKDATKGINSELSIQYKPRQGETWEGDVFYYTDAYIKSTNEINIVSEINESINSNPTYQNVKMGNLTATRGTFGSDIVAYGADFAESVVVINHSGVKISGDYDSGLIFGTNAVKLGIKAEADGAGLVTDYNASYTKLKDDEFVIGTSIGDGFKGVTINNVKETNAGVTVTPSVSSTTVKLIEANYGNFSPYISSTSNSITIAPDEQSKVTFSNTGVVFGREVTTPAVQLGQARIEQTGNILGGIWGVDLKSYVNNQIANGFVNVTTNTVQLPDALISADGNVTGGIWGTDKTLKEYIDANAGGGSGGGGGGGGNHGGSKEAVKVWTGSVTGAANTNPMDITSTEDGDFRCGGKLMLKESSGAWLEYDFDCPDSASPPVGTVQFNRQIFSQNSGASDMILAQNSLSGTKTKWSLYGHARKTYTEAWWRPY